MQHHLCDRLKKKSMGGYVKSDGKGECKYDLGGYFIINGNEKVIISQEKVANNLIQVFKNSKNTTKYSHVCEVRSLNENVFGIPNFFLACSWFFLVLPNVLF